MKGMNMYEAAKAAADFIEANPTRFNILNNNHPDDGPACLVSWMGYFMGVAKDTFRPNYYFTVCVEMAKNPVSPFTSGLNEITNGVFHKYYLLNPSEAARALRDFAARIKYKYEPRTTSALPTNHIVSKFPGLVIRHYYTTEYFTRSSSPARLEPEAVVS